LAAKIRIGLNDKDRFRVFFASTAVKPVMRERFQCLSSLFLPMPDYKVVTPQFTTCAQIQPADVASVAALGYRILINNRPDDEVPGQPFSADMALAAQAAGLDYVAIPVRGGPNADQVAQTVGVLERAEGPVFAFCRSGTRSITLWALARRQMGQDRDSLIALAAEAGYDLSNLP